MVELVMEIDDSNGMSTSQDRYSNLVGISDAAYYGTPAAQRTDSIVRAFTAPDAVEENAIDLGYVADSDEYYAECASQLEGILDECGIAF